MNRMRLLFFVVIACALVSGYLSTRLTTDLAAHHTIQVSVDSLPETNYPLYTPLILRDFPELTLTPVPPTGTPFRVTTTSVSPTDTPEPELTSTPVLPTDTPLPPTTTPTPLVQAHVRIAYIEYDPPGSNDVAGEYVYLQNQAGTANMTSWTLCDNAEHCFTFPTFILVAGSTVQVWTKSGENTATDLYWGSESAIWDNTGDTAYLRDSNGMLVHQFSYLGPH